MAFSFDIRISSVKIFFSFFSPNYWGSPEARLLERLQISKFSFSLRYKLIFTTFFSLIHLMHICLLTGKLFGVSGQRN
jgi:glycogen synthase